MELTIGNSETTTFLKCERRHYYEYILKRTPKKHSGPLAIGILGHEALMLYYIAKQQNATEEEAQRKAFLHTSQAAMGDPAYIETSMTVRKSLEWYFKSCQDDSFKIICIESSFHTKIAEDLNYGMRLDLLVEFTEGRFKGQYVLIDHKFCYNFWTQDALQINGQFAKYIGTLRKNGFPDLKWAVVNQIRYRKIKEPTLDQMCRRDFIKPTEQEIQAVMKEQVKAGERIAERHRMPLPVAEACATRTMSKDVCEKCFFLQPCKIDLMGGNSDLELKVNYKENTFGYLVTHEA